MIEAIDSSIAAQIWRGIDPASARPRRHGDKSLLALLRDPLSRDSLNALCAGDRSRTGGYALAPKLTGGSALWAPFLEMLRRGRARGIDGAVELIDAISELGRDLRGKPLDPGAASTLAFFLRPDLPVLRLDTGHAGGARRAGERCGDVAARAIPELMALLADHPPIAYPRLERIGHDWYRRRCLDIALRRHDPLGNAPY